MKALTTLLFVLSAAGSFAARVETVTIDLERPQQPFAISATEQTDVSVTANLRASGSEFDPSGWTGLLWYGTTAGGITMTNTSAAVGSMTWQIPVSSIPTNGRYTVQIFGAATNIIEEWGRGALTVRLNPAHGSLPACWISSDRAYSVATNALEIANQAIAGKVSSYIRAVESNGVHTLFFVTP